MESKAGKIVRVLSRLKAAVGYHELGMTQHALACLDSLSRFGRLGPFGLVTDVLRDEFVTHAENHISAAHALEIVACMLPAPARHAMQLTLAACYGPTVSASRTANVAATTRGIKVEAESNAG